jgi:hypothetical protein
MLIPRALSVSLVCPKSQRRVVYSQKSNNNAPFLKSGWPITFLEIETEKEAHSTRCPAPSSALHAVVVIPMAAKDFAGFMSHARPGRDCRQTFVSGILHRNA